LPGGIGGLTLAFVGESIRWMRSGTLDEGCADLGEGSTASISRSIAAAGISNCWDVASSDART
jgi:hypothetical protein